MDGLDKTEKKQQILTLERLEPENIRHLCVTNVLNYQLVIKIVGDSNFNVSVTQTS